MAASITRFDRLLRRMERNQVAARYELIGCSAQEIARLEAKYKVRLPAMYRQYLEVMGHNSGKLFTHDHYYATYPSVLKLTAETREDWKAIQEEEGGRPKRCWLPTDGLVIGTRMGLAEQFIRCHRPDDSAVWLYQDEEVMPCHRSTVGWLEQWCGEAEVAIRDGGFAHN